MEKVLVMQTVDIVSGIILENAIGGNQGTTIL
jgi:hypothetical protein